MQIRFIPCLIFHIYKSEKSGGWVGMVGGGGNIARGVKQDIAINLHGLIAGYQNYTPIQALHSML